jgi:alkylhydroperoxidase family enzyme
MSRITKLPPEQWTEELRTFAAADTATDIELGITRMLAHAPKAAMGPLQFGAAVTLNRTLPERLIELMRLRVAFHNQCRSCMAIRYSSAADTFTEDDVCSLEKPAEAENLDEREKLAIDFGERFATNHLSIDDDYFENLKAHFTEAEIIELMLHCALYVGMGRLAALLDMTEELPAGFQRPFGEAVPPTADAPIRVR